MKYYVFSPNAPTPVIFTVNEFPFQPCHGKCLLFLGPFPSQSFTWFLAIEGQRRVSLMFCVIETSVPMLLVWKPSEQWLLTCKGQIESLPLFIYFFNPLYLLDLYALA